MAVFRIEEAIARAKANGHKVFKWQVAKKLWPDSTETAQQVNMTRLCSGKQARVSVEWVQVICEMTGCSADYLFGLSND